MTATVASHRKPKQQHPLTGNSARTAVTLALASAATATAFDGAAHAAPDPTPSQVKDVKSTVDRLYQEAEVATEKYDGAKEQADKAREDLDRLQEEADRRTEKLNSAKAELGSMAATQYRSGGVDPTVRLVLSADPEHYLEGAAALERAGNRQAAAVSEFSRRVEGVQQLRDRAKAKVTELNDTRAQLRKHRVTVVRKLDAAEKLLDRLTDEQRRQIESQDAEGAQKSRADRDAGRARLRAPNARAAEAISFAYGALGKPYVWGATGPSAYDCSGLTQAAWRAAGVSLPRTTYTQINAGSRVDRSQLAPGDLVFFYSGVSHVGIYIGGGNMIHAPRPGAPVRVAPIDIMPFAGATRPA